MITPPGNGPPGAAACAGGMPARVDLLVIGGGINGAGIARDAAGRGLSVLLCEKDDLAQGTSSRSSRLVHGGLRYLEYGELRLVREALQEREVLLAMAPHLVHPLRFVLPHVAQMRPFWMLRAGLFLYDHLARRRSLAASQAVCLQEIPEGQTVRPHLRRGFVYADCRTDDARLVIANARGAADLGACIRTRTAFTGAKAGDGRWEVSLQDTRSGARHTLQARALVNAAGPWVDQVAPDMAGITRARHVRLIKGSHLLVRKFWQGEHAYLLQNTDRRVVFVTPYEDGFAMIGTTDIAWQGRADSVQISPEETRYLLDAVNRQLRCALGPEDILGSFAGVRCLVDDQQENPSALTRDYVLELNTAADGAAALSVLGGKITTYRRLAEHALDRLGPVFPDMGAAWTHRVPLPGGDYAGMDDAAQQSRWLAETGYLPAAHALGLWHRHGTLARRIVAQVQDLPGMGRHFGGGLYDCELRYLQENEWAQTAEDVLWRRSKLGLLLSPDQVAGLEQAFARAENANGTPDRGAAA